MDDTFPPSVVSPEIKYTECRISDAENVEAEADGSGGPPLANTAESQWGIGWEALTTMISLYVLGMSL